LGGIYHMGVLTVPPATIKGCSYPRQVVNVLTIGYPVNYHGF
jgi:hypothetical protein